MMKGSLLPLPPTICFSAPITQKFLKSYHLQDRFVNGTRNVHSLHKKDLVSISALPFIQSVTLDRSLQPPCLGFLLWKLEMTALTLQGAYDEITL